MLSHVSPKRFLASLVLLLAPMVSVAQQLALKTATARQVTSPLEYQLDGIIEAIRQSTLSAEVSGRVETINFDVGDQVEQGQVIVRIRDQEHRARLQQASAALDEAQARYDDAKSEFKRVQGLYKDKVVSKAAFDKASANLESTRARVEAARASVSEAQEQLDNTVVRAPYSGIVSARHIELGESTSIGQTIMSGYAMGEFRAIVNVPQSIISTVRSHQKARVILLENQQTIDTRKLTIFPYADPQNHSFSVRVDLAETNQAVFPGMLVKVAFVIDEVQRLMVPRSALVQRSEVSGIYVVGDNRVSLRQIRTGIDIYQQIEIVSGLDAGETIALDPVAAGIQLKSQWKPAQ
ncbi:MAG: efflux RND transporter periplasmic adaptor subunit [Gammaproteobacteria bacterium]|nr:efflux RND transporter periplasmic adaptor subunit [Gammaproteobacteria bacterium]